MKNILITLSIVFTTSLFASTLSPEDVIKSGLKAYDQNGTKAAIEVWIKGSALEGSKEALAQSNALQQIEDYFGKYQGYEIVKSYQLSQKSTMIYFVLNYEKGVTYASMQLYKSTSGEWVSTQFNFHTNVLMVWSNSMIFEGK